MIFDYLRTSYAFVIPLILGFFVLIFLSLISFLRGPQKIDKHPLSFLLSTVMISITYDFHVALNQPLYATYTQLFAVICRGVKSGRQYS